MRSSSLFRGRQDLQLIQIGAVFGLDQTDLDPNYTICAEENSIELWEPLASVG